MTREEIQTVLEGLNPGDRVELGVVYLVVTVGKSGIVTFRHNMSGESVVLKPYDLPADPGLSLRVIHRGLPPEPPAGSAIIDRAGFVWQRITMTWWQVGEENCMNWADLNREAGPLRVIYTPEEAS